MTRYKKQQLALSFSSSAICIYFFYKDNLNASFVFYNLMILVIILPHLLEAYRTKILLYVLVYSMFIFIQFYTIYRYIF